MMQPTYPAQARTVAANHKRLRTRVLLKVNSIDHPLDIEPRVTLLDALREHLRSRTRDRQALPLVPLVRRSI